MVIISLNRVVFKSISTLINAGIWSDAWCMYHAFDNESYFILYQKNKLTVVSLIKDMAWKIGYSFIYNHSRYSSLGQRNLIYKSALLAFEIIFIGLRKWWFLKKVWEMMIIFFIIYYLFLFIEIDIVAFWSLIIYSIC